jgi:hypothetical protein
VRAFVIAEDEVWRGFIYGSEPDDTRIGQLVESVCAFTHVPFPPIEAA